MLKYLQVSMILSVILSIITFPVHATVDIPHTLVGTINTAVSGAASLNGQETVKESFGSLFACNTRKTARETSEVTYLTAKTPLSESTSSLFIPMDREMFYTRISTLKCVVTNPSSL